MANQFKLSQHFTNSVYLRPSRCMNRTVSSKNDTFELDKTKNGPPKGRGEFTYDYIRTNSFQKILLTVGSMYMSLVHATTRPDAAENIVRIKLSFAGFLTLDTQNMMAVLGEVTGDDARKYMYEKMRSDSEGQEILRDQPRINSRTINWEALSRLPSGTLGKVYIEFLQSHRISPDTRPIVKFIDDPEMAYVMQRFREIHDLIHTVLNMPTNVIGEVAVKWVEGIQTGLPVCMAGALFGPLHLSTNQRKRYLNYYLPWAVQTGHESRFLMNVYFEKRWNQNIEDLLKELNIKPLVLPN